MKTLKNKRAIPQRRQRQLESAASQKAARDAICELAGINPEQQGVLVREETPDPPPVPKKAQQGQVKISQLWVGDRFAALDSLWTYLGQNTARKHSPESQKLAERGYGYLGDTICSFKPTDRVVFLPPLERKQARIDPEGQRS